MKRHSCFIAFLVLSTCSIRTWAEPHDLSGTEPANEVDPYLDTDEHIARVRSQWMKLAPYVSMKGLIRLEDVDLASLENSYRFIRQLRNLKFESHPLLQQEGTPYIEYLIRSENRVMPKIRANLANADNVDDLLAGALLNIFAMKGEEMALRIWQQEFDRKALSVYQELMPLVRSLAADVDSDSPDLSVEARNGSSIIVQNTLGQQLANVTLVFELATLDGRKSDHYFYIDSWEPGSVFYLRAAGDWMNVGLQGTTHGKIAMYSDQISTPSKRFRIDEHIGGTVHRILKPMIRTKPGLALRGLRVARSKVRGDNDLRLEITALQQEAVHRKKMMTERLQEEIKKLQDQLKSVGRKPSNNDSRPGYFQTSRQTKPMTRKEIMDRKQWLRNKIKDLKLQLKKLNQS